MCSFFRSSLPGKIVRRLWDFCRDQISENTTRNSCQWKPHVMFKLLAPATRTSLLPATNYISQCTLSLPSFPKSSSSSCCSEAPLCGPSQLRYLQPRYSYKKMLSELGRNRG